MEHNQAADGLLNLFTKANHDLTAVQNKLNKEFQQIYPDHANPMKLVERLKKIEEEMSSLKDECSELLTAKQVLPSENVSCNLSCDAQQTETNRKVGNKVWCVKEDVALMSSWCIASEDKVHGNRKGVRLWTQVHKLYQEARANNPAELGDRNIDMMKGRWRRISDNGNKWVAAYKEAYGRKKVGMSLTDVEIEAHAIYEASGSKFLDVVVFNEVMSKHPKWNLRSQDFSQLHPKNEKAIQESGGSSKRSRTSVDGDYASPSKLENLSIGCSTIPQPKTPINTSESLPTSEVAAEIRALRLVIDSEAEVVSRLGSARINLELKKEQRKALKMNQVLLNTLLAKDHLSPEDEEMKRRLMEIVFRHQI